MDHKDAPISSRSTEVIDDSSGKTGSFDASLEPPPSPPPPVPLDRGSPSSASGKRPPMSPISSYSSALGTASVSPRTAKILNSPDLRSNLTREQRNRDPLFFYEIVQTIGVGSMGSVARVQKRKGVVGGSARKEMQEAVQRQKRNQKCLDIPLVGGIFRFCVDGDLTHGDDSNKYLSSSLGESMASWFGKVEGVSMDGSGSHHRKSSSVVGLPLSGTDSVVSIESSASNHSTSNMQYAMKSIHLNRVTDKNFLTELRNEISILKKLDHPHVIRCIETFEHRNQIFIVMELCSGGDLYSRDPYTEAEAARIIGSILSAIAYMHSKNILHRDLKYENILFVNDSPQAEIKVIDFGLSKVYGDNIELTDGVGTIYTMAPEVLRGTYSAKADVWSVGVVAYMLLSSQMPFYGRKRRHIVEQILNGQFDFRGRRWKRISSQAKAFVEELLVLDPEERSDAHMALRSTWLNRGFSATARGPDAEEESMARHAMLRYSGYTKLKKMALMVVAHKSSSEEIGILRKIFQKYDRQRDGCIGYEDFCSALSEFGHSDDDMQEMFDAVDLDGTGKIRYTEFLAATIEAHGAISEERLAEAFDRLDSDDSGYISAENLIEILGQGFPKEEIDEIIKEADLTKDNQISYAEFLHLWEERHEQERWQQLEMLGADAMVTRKSDVMLNSFRGSAHEMNNSESSKEERDSIEGRAMFAMKKHDSAKKVGCTPTDQGISL